jgi:hypothetical protein
MNTRCSQWYQRGFKKSPVSLGGLSLFREFGLDKPIRESQERTRTADLLITTALLTREGAVADASLFLMLSTILLCGTILY